MTRLPLQPREVLHTPEFTVCLSEPNKWKATGKAHSAGREFTLHELGRTQWKVSGKNLAGCVKRIRFDASSIDEAIETASSILYKTADLSQPKLDIASAFDRALRAATGREKHKADLETNAEYFLDWCDIQGLLLWEEINFEIITRYVNELAKRKLKRKTIVHYLGPIKWASLFCQLAWPRLYDDVARDIKAPKDIGPTKWQADEGRAALTFFEVLEFLEWLERCSPHASFLVPGVMLQGLCGLQLQEALRLRWEDTDMAEGTITIQGEVKNAYRVRKLPLPRVVHERLKREVQKEGPVVPYPHPWRAYTHLLARVLKK
jgi:integrase